MISEIQAERLAGDWLTAWNSHDIKLIMSHYADNVEFTSPFVSALLNKNDGKITGKPTLEAYFLRGLSKYPELNFQLIEVLPGISSITLLYHSVNNLLAAETMEIDAAGKIFKVLAHYKSLDQHPLQITPLDS